MRLFECKTFEAFDKTISLLESREEYRRIDSSVKEKFVKESHERILYDLVEAALNELYPPPSKAARKRAPKAKRKADHDE